MTQKNDFLETEPLGRLLFRLALPAIAAQLINMLYNIVDRIYIGHIPQVGALALTGVGVCLPLILIVSAFAALVSMGGAPRASIFMGKGDNTTAEAILGNCFTLQLLLSAVLTAILLCFNRPLLLTFGASANTIDYATAYMGIYAIGTVFVQLTLGMNAFITAQGFAKTGMLTVLIGAVLNIVLDPILIFGFHMGVRGAALATILSQAVSALWVTAYLCGPKTILHLRRAHFGLSSKIILPAMALGCGGHDYFIQRHAICHAAHPGLSPGCPAHYQLQLRGPKPRSGAPDLLASPKGLPHLLTFWLLLKASLTYSVILGIAIQCFPQVFASIFTADAPLLTFTAWALKIYGFGIIFFGIQMACQMTFISLGNAKSSIIVAVVRKFVLLIPLIYLLPTIISDKTMAVYLAEPIADVTAVIFTAILFYFQFKKALAAIEPNQSLSA